MSQCESHQFIIGKQQGRQKQTKKSSAAVFLSYLCFEGLLNVCTQCAPFVCFLQRFSCQLHSTLHLIYLHQDLVENMHETYSSSLRSMEYSAHLSPVLDFH